MLHYVLRELNFKILLDLVDLAETAVLRNCQFESVNKMKLLIGTFESRKVILVKT